MRVLFCKACDAETQHTFKPRPDTPHDGEYRCNDCGKFWGWKPKEKNSVKRPPNKHTPESLCIDHCQLCMRSKKRLVTNETLAVHHVKEIQHGGPDLPENIWVLCTSCHALVHHQRTYLNEHHAALWERYERFKQKLWAVSPEDYEAILTEYREAAGL